MIKRHPQILTSLLCVALISSCGQQQASKSNAEIKAPPLTSGVYLENFDRSVNPGDDFFRYVNGTWLKETEMPADKPRYGSFVILADKAKEDLREIVLEATKSSNIEPGSEEQKLADLYRSFMNTDKLEELKLTPLAQHFAAIDAIHSKADLARYFAHAAQIGSDAPFAFYVSVDAKKPDETRAIFVHTGLGLPDRDFYFKTDEKSADIRKNYLGHIEKMLALADMKDPQKSAKIIMDLETRLAEAHWTRVERRDRDKTYNKFSTTALTSFTPAFPWQTYLKAAKLDKEQSFVIQTPSFYQKFAGIFTQTSLDTWKTYQKWHLLRSYAGQLSQEFDQQNFAFYGTTLQGVEQQEERWKRSISAINDVLGEVLGKVYVEKHFKPEDKMRVEELVENLREAYRQSILELDWMSEATKQEALVKLAKFNPKIGYPKKWRDYSSLTIDAQDLVGNFIRASEFFYDIQIDKLGKPVDRDEWQMTPQTVNAYYNPGMNEIVFPAAILQPPFFNSEADDAVNYGAIGAVIGHEMGHGFDDQGSKSDGNGELRNWWTEKDQAEFQRRTQRLVQQFDQYEALPGEKLNGKLSLGENIGDLGGLTIAYKAYQLSLEGKKAKVMDGFNGDQRFFIGWAQVWAFKYREEALRQMIAMGPHSPAEFRVNGVVKNIPAFIQAFDLQPTDKLYLPPEERVKIW